MTKRRLAWSASQIESLGLCTRRWGYRRIEGLHEASSDAASAGTAYHAEIERWAKGLAKPTSAVARAAMALYPHPGVAEIEVPIGFSTPRAVWVGRIDAVCCWVDGDYAPLGASSTICLVDLKTTGWMKNAKSADVLAENAAACLYAYEAYLGGANHVVGRWVYVTTKETRADGTPRARVVHFDLPWGTVARRVGELDAEAGYANRLYEAHDTAGGLPRNEESCFAFRRQCGYYERCQPCAGDKPFDFDSLGDITDD